MIFFFSFVTSGQVLTSNYSNHAEMTEQEIIHIKVAPGFIFSSRSGQGRINYNDSPVFQKNINMKMLRFRSPLGEEEQVT